MFKVSIIIPVYNVEKYLRQCLDSVVNQTLTDIEIICVNDCSPDNSAEILSEYAKKDNRIKIITLEENGGLGNARNVALKAVQGDYIMFLDSDDWLELDACEKAYSQISKNNNDFVILGLYAYNQSTNKRCINSKKIEPFLDIQGKASAMPVEIHTPFFGNGECWYKIYKKGFLLDNNLEFDKGAFEDQRFNVRILTLAKSISVLNKPLYNYRKHNESITASSTSWKDYINAKKRAYELLKTLDLPHPKFRKYFVIATIKYILFYFRKYSKLDKHIRNEFYNEIHEFFNVLENENNIEELKDYIDYISYKRIIKNDNYPKYKICTFTQNLFYIENFSNRIKLSILGIKFSIKLKLPKFIRYYLSNKELSSIKETVLNKIPENGHAYKSFCKTNNRTPLLLDNLKEINDFYFIPNKGNLGDIAIACSCYQYFDTHNLKYKVIDMTRKKARKIKQKFNLVYGGGGLFVKYYQKSYQNILQIFKSKNLKKAIILPASFYDCQDVMDVLDERFTVYCREKQSYEYCIAHNKKAKFILADDMVFGLNTDFYKDDKYDLSLLNNFISSKNRYIISYLRKEVYPYYKETSEILTTIKPENSNYIGYFFRTDNESSLSFDNRKSIIDLSLVANSYCADKSLCLMFARLFFQTLDKFSIVVTDRLHIGICAMLLGKQVYLIDNSYKKVSNVYNHSMKDLSNVKIIKNIDEIPEDYTIQNHQENKTFSGDFIDFIAEWGSIKNNFGGEKRLWRK